MSGLKFAEAAGDERGPATLDQLRALNAEQVLAAWEKNPGMRPQLVVDGWIFPDTIQAIFQAGQQNRVNVLVGFNADEATSMFGQMPPIKASTFRERLQRQYGDFAEEVLALYPVTSDGGVQRVLQTIIRDSWFAFQMKTWAQLMSTVGTDAYLYYFTRVPPIEDSEVYGAYHGAEHVYIVGNLDNTSFKPESTDWNLSQQMMGYWTNFAETGNPNGERLVEWPAYDLETEYYIELGDEVRIGQHLLREECAFFRRYNESGQNSGSPFSLLVP
jgi:para-nitrobenzyl esterase